MTEYSELAPIFPAQETALWDIFYSLAPNGECSIDTDKMRALIRTLPLVRERPGTRTTQGSEPYMEYIGFVPTMQTATWHRGSEAIIEPRFLWISICVGDIWNECCMGDDSGIKTWNHLTY